jgi:hypothetical protein
MLFHSSETSSDDHHLHNSLNDSDDDASDTLPVGGEEDLFYRMLAQVMSHMLSCPLELHVMRFVCDNTIEIRNLKYENEIYIEKREGDPIMDDLWC